MAVHCLSRRASECLSCLNPSFQKGFFLKKGGSPCETTPLPRTILSSHVGNASSLTAGPLPPPPPSPFPNGSSEFASLIATKSHKKEEERISQDYAKSLPATGLDANSQSARTDTHAHMAKESSILYYYVGSCGNGGGGSGALLSSCHSFSHVPTYRYGNVAANWC